MFTNKGYVGYSESVRSKKAKENGVFPKSLWTKQRMIEILEEEGREDLINKLNNIPVYILKDECLLWEEWHHTSKFYNVTEFYSFSIEYLEELTDQKVKELKERRRLDNIKNKEKKEETKRIREEKRKKKEELNYKLSLMQYSKYKRESAYLKAIEDGRLKIEDLEEIKQLTEMKQFINRFNGCLGNLKKYTHFKKFEELKQAILNNEFDLKEIKDIDEKKDGYNLLFVLENVKKYKGVVND